jgi:hypothetical protein
VIGADLMGCTVYDADGTPLGKVHDLRFAAGARHAYRLTALECGGVGLAHRLRYAGQDLAGPWPLTVLLSWLTRHSVVVPWSAVERVEGRRIDIGLRRTDLRPAHEEAGRD